MNNIPEMKIKLENLSSDVAETSQKYKELKSEYNTFIEGAQENPHINVKERHAYAQKLTEDLVKTGEKLDKTLEEIIHVVNTGGELFNADVKDEIARIFLDFTDDFQEAKERFSENLERLSQFEWIQEASNVAPDLEIIEEKDTVIEKEAQINESKAIETITPQSYSSMITSSLYNGLIYACFTVKNRLFTGSNPEKIEIKEKALEEKVEESKDDRENVLDAPSLLKKEDLSTEQIIENFSLDRIQMGFEERKKAYQPILEINEQVDALREKGFAIKRLRLDASPLQIATTQAAIEKILNSSEYKNL